MAKHRARRSSPLYLPSAFELFKPSRDIVLKNIWVFGPLFVVPLLFLVNSWLYNVDRTNGALHWHLFLENHSSTFNGPTPPLYASYIVRFSIMAIVGTALAIITQMMLHRANLDAAQGHSPSLEKGWQTVKELGWRLLGLYIIVGLTILAGLILFIVPGLFMIRRYLFSPYVMIDKKCDIFTAMEESAKLGKRNTGAVWGLMGVLFLIMLVGVVPVIGSLTSFILGFLYTVAVALRYQQLKKLA